MSNIKQLITDHLDIWTGADTGKKSGRGRASSNANSVYGIKKLRELILELAVRGQLVPQDPNDEPAIELLKRIQAEKARLLTEGKIKRDKPLATMTEDEKPYVLPQSWEWVRLPEIYYSISVSGNQLLSSEINEFGLFPVVDQGQRFIAGYTDDETRLIRLPGPVVVFGDHTTERKYIDFDFVAGADGVKILRPFLIYEKFFWLQLVGLKLEGRGYARHFKVLNQYSFAIPPMNEQTRIVAKVDELMALCDQLEAQHNNAADAHEQLVSHLLGTLTQSPVCPELVEGYPLTDSPSTSSGRTEFEENWQRIATHFDTLFSTEASIDALKQTLLQLAVMGKLVPQDPNDEPASELLKRIQAEKARLLTEGKIKRDKPLATMTEDEKPYVLPQSWEWVRLPEIYYSISVSGNQLLSSEINEFGLFPVVDQGQRFIAGYTDDETRLIRLPGPVVVFGDHTTERKYIDFDFVAGADGVKILRPFLIYEKFFWLQLVGLKVEGRGYARHFKVLNQCSFAIPPMNEQTRIVAKVDELMRLCEQLKSRICDARQCQQKLADVLLENALEAS